MNSFDQFVMTAREEIGAEIRRGERLRIKKMLGIVCENVVREWPNHPTADVIYDTLGIVRHSLATGISVNAFAPLFEPLVRVTPTANEIAEAVCKRLATSLNTSVTRRT